MRFSFLLPLLALTTPAYGQSLEVTGGAALEYFIEPDGAGTDNRTDLSFSSEVAKSGLYAGLAVLISSQSAGDEIALSFGYRGEFAGGVAYDLGYTHYAYPHDTTSEYGELVLGFEKGFGDQLTATLDLGYDPGAQLANAYVGAEFAMNDKVSFSANYGVFEVDSAPSEQEWDFGATYALSDEAAIDLRYFDGSDYADGYVGLALTWDTTLLSR